MLHHIDSISRRPSRISAAFPDRDAFFSERAWPFHEVLEFADDIVEIDLNPVIVNCDGCRIVDALVVPAARVED